MIESRDTEATPEEQRDSAGESWEKDWDDWWKTDRVDAVGWAALFLWGALVVVAHNTGFRDDFDWWDGSGVFWIGAGAIVLIETLFRSAMPRYRAKWGWTLFWGSAFLAIGLSELASPVWFALPLAVVAAVILKGAIAGDM